MNASKEQELVEQIRLGGRPAEMAMKRLYSAEGLRQSAINFIKNLGAEAHSAEDVFQDAVRHLILNVRKRDFELTSSLKTYLFSICRLTWLNKLRKEKKIYLEEDNARLDKVDENTPASLLEYFEERTKLAEILGGLGEKCKAVLAYWSLDFSMKEIAMRTGYDNESAVRKKKYDCMKALTKLFKEKPHLVAYFKER